MNEIGPRVPHPGQEEFGGIPRAVDGKKLGGGGKVIGTSLFGVEGCGICWVGSGCIMAMTSCLTPATYEGTRDSVTCLVMFAMSSALSTVGLGLFCTRFHRAGRWRNRAGGATGAGCLAWL